MNTKKKFAIAFSALALIIISGALILKPYSVNADEKDINTIKEELKVELKEEYQAKYDEQQKKIDELNSKLDLTKSELIDLINKGDKATSEKITYKNVEKNRQEENKVSTPSNEESDTQVVPGASRNPASAPESY